MCYEDEIENRRKKEEHLTEWLRSFTQATTYLPKIEQLKEITEWEIDALSNAPDEANEIPKGDMLKILDSDLRYLIHALPPLEFSPELFSTTDGSTTSSSAVVFDNVVRVGDIPTENAKVYREQYTSQYQELQKTLNFSKEIRVLFKNIEFSSTLSRFEVAEKSYYLFKAGSIEKTAAAMEMRTFLDGLKGDLFNLARKLPNENMTWDEMALRLANGNKSSQEYSLLLRHKTIQSSLVSRLSSIGKDREGQSRTNLHYIWTETLSHVYAILNLVKIG